MTSEDGTAPIPADDPTAVAATAAIQAGDLDALRRLLADTPGLASARIGDETMTRTLLHAATDWPGHFPRVGESITALAAAGADPDARFAGPHRETPLHWAASSDDVEALDALLDAGADIEADGAVLGGGPPMADAVGFGNWNAARRLRERGADTTLGAAAALGLMDRVVELTSGPERPTAEQVTMSLWHASHGGQREASEYLIDHGGDPDWIGWDDLTTVDLAQRGGHDDLAAWLRSRGAHTAAELR